MSPLVIANGDERAMLGSVMRARKHGWPLIVPPAGVADLPAMHVPPGAMVVFTSGSTGVSRGILRTHDSWTASLDPLTELMGLRASDRVCVVSSVHATLALYGALHAMHVTGEVMLADESRDRATVAHASPVAARDLLESPPSGLRLMVVAGDRVPESLRDLAARRGVELLEYYGATELSFVAYRHTPDASDEPGLAAFPGVDIRVQDQVVWARSDFLALGYVGTDDGPGRWLDGWATVGDEGSWVDGRLVVAGRGDAAVAVGGHTVHVHDVESFLRDHLDGIDLAVTSMPHARLGAVLACVVVDDGTGTDLAVVRKLAHRLPGPARPRRWFVVRQLPQTIAGKVDRAALRRLVQDA